MYDLVMGLILVAAILMILIVLVQNSKGGGLASNFASSNQVLGVRKTTDFLEKATWSLAIGLVVLSVLGSALIPREQVEVERSRLENVDFSSGNAVQNFPSVAPEETADQPATLPTETE